MTKESNNIQEEKIKDESTENVASESESTKTNDWESKFKEINDKYLRLYSEFDNFRKRTSKERIELLKVAGEDVFKSILPVIDDFERALKSIHETSDIKALKEGIELIYLKLKSNLSSKGLESMTSIGSEFNTDLHEAITNIPATSEDMKGKIIDELEKGYMLNGKVIRYAKVVVGN